jgi:parvulin-like peptidyl-prolyl isomerase
VESETGFHLVQLIDREQAFVPPLEEVRALVRQDLERRRGDEALRRYLDELRARIPVSVDESVLSDASEPSVT